MKAHELIDYINENNLLDCNVTFAFFQECDVYSTPTYRHFNNMEVSDVSHSEQILQLTGIEA